MLLLVACWCCGIAGWSFLSPLGDFRPLTMTMCLLPLKLLHLTEWLKETSSLP